MIKNKKLKLSFLGTGTSQGIPVIACSCATCNSFDKKDKRLRTSAMISYNDKNYVIDVGPDFRKQMLINKVKTLEAVLITHEHTDHMIGLDDLRPFIFKAKRNMPLFALPRVVDDIKKRFAYAFGKVSYPGAPSFDMINIEYGDILDFDGMKIEVIPIHHGNLMIAGFIIEQLVYITDAKYIEEEIIKKMEGCDVLVINALRKRSHHAHFSLQEALMMIERIKAKRSYIVHLSHYLGRHKEVQDNLPDNVFLAYDGLSLVI